MIETEFKRRILSIVIPVYNEERTISELLSKVLLSSLPRGWEKDVIVVDDGSTDDSRTALKAFESSCRFIFRDRNGGKGAALKDGFKAARGDYVIIQDADLEYDPDNYVTMVRPLLVEPEVVVFGSRVLVSQNVPFSRVYFYAGLVLTRIFNACFGSKISDLATCYKVFPRSYVEELCLLPADDFVFDVVELSHALLKRAGLITEVPIRYVSRRKCEGKKLNWTHGLRCVQRILSLWLAKQSSAFGLSCDRHARF